MSGIPYESSLTFAFDPISSIWKPIGCITNGDGTYALDVYLKGGSSVVTGNVTIVNPLGQQVSAASVAVVIASDQSAIPVTSSPASQAAATGHTKLLTVTNASAVAITTTVTCSLIQVQEDNSVAGWPTTPFQIMIPLSNNTAVQFAAGSSIDFPAPNGSRWAAGVTVGYIILPAAGSTSFLQMELG